MKQAMKLSEDGTLTELDLDDMGEGKTADVLHREVDGFFEVVGISPGIDMWINEEGKYTPGFGVNRVASVLLGWAGGMDGDYIMGPAVFTGLPDDEGDTLGLTAEARELLIELVNRAKKAL